MSILMFLSQRKSSETRVLIKWSTECTNAQRVRYSFFVALRNCCLATSHMIDRSNTFTFGKREHPL